MKDLLYDMANIYQQKALDSLDASDLAHAKRYREAADALEAKDKEITELDALRNDAVLRMDTYKALCDQMVQVIQMSDGRLYESGKEALDAWKEMK